MIKAFIAKIKKNDFILSLLVCAALVYSLLLIFSMQRAGSYNYLTTQIMAVLLGTVIGCVVAVMDYNDIVKFWYLFAALGVFLACLVFLFGIQVSGTDDTAWLQIGNLSVQPSEFIKICFIITFAKHISVIYERGRIKSFPAALALLLHAGIPMALIHLQGEDGTVLIFAFIALITAFSAGIAKKYYIMLAAGVLTAIPFIWNYVLNDEHRNRFIALLDIDGNSMSNYGWQQYQGKISIASGMLTGAGYGNGTRVEYGIVPEQENDFIFSVAGEELGFIGCCLIILILLLIMLKIVVIGINANNIEGKCICAGVFSLIASQTIINLGMVLGFLPVIGITLPFFSAGGSSIMSILICIGLVQSVSANTDKKISKTFSETKPVRSVI